MGTTKILAKLKSGGVSPKLSLASTILHPLLLLHPSRDRANSKEKQNQNSTYLQGEEIWSGGITAIQDTQEVDSHPLSSLILYCRY